MNILKIGKELQKITGNKYELFEEYEIKDADAVIIVSSSTAGTAKSVVDKMREVGKKVGVLKIKLYRPFPYKEMSEVLSELNKSKIAVMDRAINRGSIPPLFTDIVISSSKISKKPKIQSTVFGLGGREITEKDIENLFEELLKNKIDENEIKYIGLRK